jgi:acetylornithine deacetylase/succinyl-diaminopimelate desuccinylase-like protein
MLWQRLAFVFLLVLCVLLYRTYIIFQADPAIFQPCSSIADNHSLQFDQTRLQTFQTLLRFQTVSYEKDQQNFDQLEKCRDFIKTHYQELVTKNAHFVQLHVIAKYSLLFAVRGSDPQLKPFLFSSHMDVVPAPHVDRWTHPPFEAVTDRTFIFARGALDDK